MNHSAPRPAAQSAIPTAFEALLHRPAEPSSPPPEASANTAEAGNGEPGEIAILGYN